MLLPYDIDRAKLLAEAKHLVRRAVERGWMSYPHKVQLNDDGTPINVVEPDYEVTSTSHTPELCRKAYSLRERGLTLEQVAMACGVARGSVAYIISKGHEMYLQQEREAMNTKTIILPKSHKESLGK
jgi:hypothetical protein